VRQAEVRLVKRLREHLVAEIPGLDELNIGAD
jgi:hypothetical protein